METQENIRKHHKLSDLSKSLKSMIEKQYKGKYWVKAEIAKLNFYPKSGHCYPDLVEKSEGKIRVQMRSIIWRHTYQAIQRKFLHHTQEELRTGLNVLFLVELKYDGLHGLSLNILDVDPILTLGEMARERMESIFRLQNEGIFEQNKNLTLPLLPKRLAIISVITSKGYSDFMKIIEPIREKYGLSLMLFPSLLQGDGAVSSITENLHRIEKVKEHFDAILLIRGGGSDVGLQVYNNYELARAIAVAPLPVLTGIGHVTNETVIDMVANKNKITPTDLGYFLVERFENFEHNLKEIREKLVNYTEEILAFNYHHLDEVKRNFSFISQKTIHTNRAQLSQIKNTIPLLSKRGVLKENNSLEIITEKISLLSPENVLKRGYSITYHKGKVLTNAKEVKIGDNIITKLHKGEIKSTKTK